jgi:hypothetical protein
MNSKQAKDLLAYIRKLTNHGRHVEAYHLYTLLKQQ